MVNGRNKKLTSNVQGENHESLEPSASVLSLVVVQDLHIERGIAQLLVEGDVSGELVVEGFEA